MNSFFKSFWAALLAFVVGSILFSLLTVLVFAGIAASLGSSKAVSLKPNSVLKIDMASTIVDAPNNKVSEISFPGMVITRSNTLLEVLRAIEVAENDDNIRGIYINFTGIGGMGISHAEEIRAAILRFKENSGKFVVAYNETYSQLGYYFCSVADKIIMNPEGGMDWKGLAANVMFYKGLLDKLDVQVEIFRHGTFKSAVEPYMTDRMSPANRLQMETYVNSMWGVLLEDIAAARPANTKEQLHSYASTLAVKTPADATKLGLVDYLLYEDQVNSLLTSLINGGNIDDFAGIEEKEAPEMISLGDYVGMTSLSTRRVSRNKVAIVYAEGSINGGQSGVDAVGSATVAAQLAKVRKDKNVKAVVFRVNSPGGSALASEVMWREMELLRQEKPVIVSMGGYAASGGYYIACNADVILADRSTLTGSIGVFGMMANLQKTLNNKLGITIDVAKSTPYGDMGGPFRAVTPDERQYWQSQVEDTYTTFVNHVAQGRNMTFDAVDAIGQGRVWLGVDAQSIGLIDGHGGLIDAISLAADRAGVSSDFRIYEVTDEKESLQVLMEAVIGGSAKTQMRDDLGEAFVQYNHLMETISEPGVQARMPYVIEFN